MSLTAVQRAALAHVRDQDHLIRIATRETLTVVARMRVQVLRAFRNGAGEKTLLAMIRAIQPQVVPLVSDAMQASHMAGIVRTVGTVSPKIEPVSMATTTELDPVLDLLKRRAGMSPSEIKAVEDQFGAQAITATGDAFSVLENKIQSAVRDIVTEGLHGDAGLGRMMKAFTDAGVTTDNPSLIKTVFNTEVSKAYNGGRWAAAQDPAIQNVLWGYEYVTVGDDRVRPNHAAMDGMRLPKDDPRWSELWPPNGYNCRCSTIEVFTTDKSLARTKNPDRGAVADDGFAFNYGEVVAG